MEIQPATRKRILDTAKGKVINFYPAVKMEIQGNPMEDWLNYPQPTRSKARTFAKNYIKFIINDPQTN